MQNAIADTTRYYIITIVTTTNNYAFGSNFLLICCFVLGIILKHCIGETDDGEDDLTDDDEGRTCDRFIAGMAWPR